MSNSFKKFFTSGKAEVVLQGSLTVAAAAITTAVVVKASPVVAAIVGVLGGTYTAVQAVNTVDMYLQTVAEDIRRKEEEEYRKAATELLKTVEFSTK